ATTLSRLRCGSRGPRPTASSPPSGPSWATRRWAAGAGALPRGSSPAPERPTRPSTPGRPWPGRRGGGAGRRAASLRGRKGARRFAACEQCALLRDILGNPLRPVAIDPLWRTAAVDALARGVYEERAFDRLPFLADALEEAGCTSEEILSHCRGPGHHTLGC